MMTTGEVFYGDPDNLRDVANKCARKATYGKYEGMVRKGEVGCWGEVVAKIGVMMGKLRVWNPSFLISNFVTWYRCSLGPLAVSSMTT